MLSWPLDVAFSRSNGYAILLRGQHGDPKREPQGECFGPSKFFRDCSNRLLGRSRSLGNLSGPGGEHSRTKSCTGTGTLEDLYWLMKLP